MLDDPQQMAHIREKLASVRNMLGVPGAAERTADIGLSMLYPDFYQDPSSPDQ
jgi:hypothetical protein